MTGDASVGGDLSVGADITATGNISAGGNLSITGTTTLSGTTTAHTESVGDNSTKVATTAFVKAKIESYPHFEFDGSGNLFLVY